MERKYKIGDKVVLHGVISHVVGEDSNYPYRVVMGEDENCFEWFSESVLEQEENGVKVNDSEKTYEDGLMNAWELMKTLADMDMETVHEIFGDSYYNVLHKYSPKKALEKYLQYEEGKIFHVGDKVTTGQASAVITCMYGNSTANLLFSDGSMSERVDVKELKKTGDKIDLTELFNGIKNKEQ